MGQNSRIIMMKLATPAAWQTQIHCNLPTHLKEKFFLCCLLMSCFVLLSCGPGFANPAEMTEFMEKFSVQHKKQKQALKKLAKKPLTENQQKLLSQLLDQEGSLDVVLSSESYIAYLNGQVGVSYKDFPTYVASMPTLERKSKVLLALRDVLSPKIPTEEIQLSLHFYFELRKLFANDLDMILNPKELTEFQQKYFIEPLMAQYSSKEELQSAFPQIMQLSMVPNVMAGMETQVFHDAWNDRLKKYGSREGLLRCAIATPNEFALTRSFVKDTETLEKWILTPLEPLKTKKKTENKKED